MSREHPVKGIIRGSAFATAAAVLVPVQVWLYKYAQFDARFAAMIFIGGIQVIALALAMMTLAQTQRSLKKK